jgi:CheY-like chemotaxis protein
VTGASACYQKNRMDKRIYPAITLILCYITASKGLVMHKLAKILLVDDDEVNNFINVVLLEELEISDEIAVLTNGRLALNYIVNHCSSADMGCPTLVIFDHQMPVMDGIEFIKAFQELPLPHKENIILLLLGVDSQQRDIDAFLKLGVHEFTGKPLSAEKVMEVYEKYWNQVES